MSKSHVRAALTALGLAVAVSFGAAIVAPALADESSPTIDSDSVPIVVEITPGPSVVETGSPTPTIVPPITSPTPTETSSTSPNAGGSTSTSIPTATDSGKGGGVLPWTGTAVASVILASLGLLIIGSIMARRFRRRWPNG